MVAPLSDFDGGRCPRLWAPWTWLNRHAWVTGYDSGEHRSTKFCRRCGRETRGIFDFGARRLDR